MAVACRGTLRTQIAACTELQRTEGSKRVQLIQASERLAIGLPIPRRRMKHSVEQQDIAPFEELHNSKRHHNRKCHRSSDTDIGQPQVASRRVPPASTPFGIEVDTAVAAPWEQQCTQVVHKLRMPLFTTDC
jgi:hypothetical protein